MIPLEQLIATYNSRGHQVTALCSDSEAICRSLATPLGLLHAHITHTTPDAHCHKVERAIQQIDHHPGNNVFHSPPSTNPLIRSNFEIISLIPFGWKPKAVLQQTYIQTINPTYEDILLRSDYPAEQSHRPTWSAPPQSFR